MPLLPPIVLSRPYILVTKSESATGITVQLAAFVFGNVEMIYDTCDDIVVNEKILFDINTAKALLYGSTVFYLVDEATKLFKEPIPL